MRLHQTATYWAKGSRNGFGGIDYPAPETLKVRWEENQALFIDAMGEESVSKAVVYCGRRLDDEGYLFLGESTEANPVALYGAHKIRAFSVTPNLRNTREEFKAWL